MINRNKVENEFNELLKDQKLNDTLESEKSLMTNISIGFIGVMIGFMIININNIFIPIFLIYGYMLFKNQKSMDQHVFDYITNEKEISKVLATISKGYYNWGFIKLFIILTIYLNFLVLPSLIMLYEIAFFIMIIDILVCVYYYVNKNKFYSYYIAYLYKRIDLYVKNELFEEMINTKFDKYYN